jgi:hypothetical protein
VDDIPVNEKALWLAVLIQTTADLVGINCQPTNGARTSTSARAWFVIGVECTRSREKSVSGKPYRSYIGALFHEIKQSVFHYYDVNFSNHGRAKRFA